MIYRYRNYVEFCANYYKVVLDEIYCTQEEKIASYYNRARLIPFIVPDVTLVITRLLVGLTHWPKSQLTL